jgi:hypothetical protein
MNKIHDYRIQKELPDLPKDVMSMLDLGFLGVENGFSEQQSLLSVKK